MKNVALVALGAVLVVVGVVFALQGLNVLGGSGMSGKTTWAVIGPIVAVVGLGVAAVGVRGRRSVR